MGGELRSRNKVTVPSSCNNLPAEPSGTVDPAARADVLVHAITDRILDRNPIVTWYPLSPKP